MIAKVNGIPELENVRIMRGEDALGGASIARPLNAWLMIFAA
jgi:hypothetical protein